MMVRVIFWGALALTTVAVSWLWPQISRTPSDIEIARSFLEDGEPEKALLFFDDPRWRGIAAYRARRFAEASRNFNEDETVASLYNMGNARAQLREWDEAIAAYERVLRFNPDHEDARYNLSLVKRASTPPNATPVDVEEQIFEKQAEGEDPTSSIPQEATPQSTRAREAEKSDKAGNTSDTEEIGETEDRKPQPQNSTGDSGRAGAVGETSDEKDSRDNRAAGPVDLKARSSARAAEILLRRITDDPEKVLKARLKAAYAARIGKPQE